MATDDNWLRPAWDKSWDVLAQDGLTKNCATENISDRSIGRQPHLLKLEFFNALFVWCDCGALDSNVVFQNGMGSIDRNLVVGLVAIWQTQVVVSE